MSSEGKDCVMLCALPAVILLPVTAAATPQSRAVFVFLQILKPLTIWYFLGAYILIST